MWIWEADFSRTGWRIASLDHPKMWPECTIIMNWKSQFISSKYSFLIESWKSCSASTPLTTFVPTQAWGEVQKHFYFHDGAKKRLEILSQKLTGNSRDFQGWRMTRWKCIKAEPGSHVPISSSSGGSQGTRWHWSQTNTGRGQGGGRGRGMYLLPAEQICQLPVKHMIIMELHVLHSVFILLLI